MSGDTDARVKYLVGTHETLVGGRGMEEGGGGKEGRRSRDGRWRVKRGGSGKREGGRRMKNEERRKRRREGEGELREEGDASSAAFVCRKCVFG